MVPGLSGSREAIKEAMKSSVRYEAVTASPALAEYVLWPSLSVYFQETDRLR
jgi:hypothetical protein